MNKLIISTGTVTYAMKARDILKRKGYNCYMERRSSDIGKFGCGYAVIVKTDDPQKVKEILIKNKIKILKITTEAAQ